MSVWVAQIGLSGYETVTTKDMKLRGMGDGPAGSEGNEWGVNLTKMHRMHVLK